MYLASYHQPVWECWDKHLLVAGVACSVDQVPVECRTLRAGLSLKVHSLAARMDPQVDFLVALALAGPGAELLSLTSTKPCQAVC